MNLAGANHSLQFTQDRPQLSGRTGNRPLGTQRPRKHFSPEAKIRRINSPKVRRRPHSFVICPYLASNGILRMTYVPIQKSRRSATRPPGQIIRNNSGLSPIGKRARDTGPLTSTFRHWRSAPSRDPAGRGHKSRSDVPSAAAPYAAKQRCCFPIGHRAACSPSSCRPEGKTAQS